MLAAVVKGLQDKGIDVLIVSSGAIGLGMDQLKFTERPKELSKLQACASVGQSILTETWRQAFQPQSVVIAQLLLTRDDIRGENRHQAVRRAVDELLSQKIVPVINENDAVSHEEIKFGDNDVLSALISELVGADALFILSTVRGLLDMENGETLISEIKEITPEIESLAGGTDSSTSVGGMKSKVEAAKIATAAGCLVFIGDGKDPSILERILAGNKEGTVFLA